MDRSICIHAHFYQPPRENPWLETVELQDSAYPYHDWNERITAECYGPNTAARILDEEGRIARIVNNFARMSFSMGPSLLSWMERSAAPTYAAILAADRVSRDHFGGHGCALAHTHDHVILPLARERDKRTQVVWGLRDFEHRFGRTAEGMWLAETAVDLETLDILAENGVKFTVLAPHQAARVRPIGHSSWQDVAGARVDPTMPYLLHTPAGHRIVLFFYDGPISQAVNTERLLANGHRFGERLLSGFDDSRDHPQFVHIVNQGETYGHYHRRGEMALACALQYVEDDSRVRLTNYGEFLELHPPTHEVQILERTCWSCSHDLGRFTRDCGCNTGQHPTWSQSWRAPLRQATQWLHDELSARFEKEAAASLREPFAARDDYISLMLDRSPLSVETFFERNAQRPLSLSDRSDVLRLLEIQRQCQAMFSSSGWFFDDVSRMETVQILLHACRALQLADPPGSLEGEFVERLSRAKSNVADHRDAAVIYEKWVRPARVDLARVVAHHAVSSLLDPHPLVSGLSCYEVESEDYQVYDAGSARVVVGRALVRSTITLESGRFVFGVLHFGDHNVNAGLGPFDSDPSYEKLVESISEASHRADVPEVVRVLDKHFGGMNYSVQSLFRDMRRRFLNLMLESTLTDDEAIYRQLYERHVPMMRFLSTLDAPLPTTFRTAAEVVLNSELRGAFSSGIPDPAQVRTMLDRAETWSVKLDTEGLAFTLAQTIERHAQTMCEQAGDIHALEPVENIVAIAEMLPFDIDFSNIQTAYYDLWRRVYVDMLEHGEEGDEGARTWADRFMALGERLGVRVHEMRDSSEMTTVSSVVRDLLSSCRVPRATYRVQFNPSFTFADAQAIVPYLHDLGISDCYASPILKPRPGSTHGYDICEHGQLNPALGGEEAFELFSAALRSREMGLLLDTVPNHMGIGHPCNLWWMDLLENGPASPYASFFDVEWNPVKPELAHKVLLPILEDQYGRVLEAGKLRLVYDEGAFFLTYYETRLPLAPRTYSQILSHFLERLSDALGPENEALQEYQSVLTALGYLPLFTETEPERIAERQREKEVVKRRIDALYQGNQAVRTVIDEAVVAFNGNVGEPRSFDLLDTLLDSQAFRPAFWRVAAEEINYRRFFDINELAAIRTEDSEVFDAVHALVFKLLVEGKATGLRIDHLDGLYDPCGYLRRLQETYVTHMTRSRLQGKRDEVPEEVLAHRVCARIEGLFGSGPDARGGRLRWPLYVVAEKILAEGESLPLNWAAAGSTGYDFLAMTDGLFVDSLNASAFDQIYQRFAEPIRFQNLVNETKKMTMLVAMASEIYALAHRLERIAEKNRRYRDFTLDSLTFAIREVIAGLSVYRTYITGEGSLTDRDWYYIESAVANARRRNPRTAAAIFDFIRDTLLLRNLGDFGEEDREMLLSWVRKFQQVTGPVMAKGVEDTAFYVHNRLVSLNEVGGHPEHFGCDVATYHERNTQRQQAWPHGMLCSSTHDTKRSEDVRARISVLSEMPGEWSAALERWAAINELRKLDADGVSAPDGNDEYLLYQTIVGAWPMEWTVQGAIPPIGEAGFEAFRERIAAYMQKATKEAKRHTSWVNPNDAYDTAVREFVGRVVPEDPQDCFLADMHAFACNLAFFGRFNSLSLVTLKLTAPGVPDVYQGTEMWDLSLVDPDNRRPVDFEKRRQCLADLRSRLEPAQRQALIPELLDSAIDGRIKLMTLHLLLEHRRANPDLYAEGNYEPVEVLGSRADHAVSFSRSHDGQRLIVAAPRLVCGLVKGERRAPMGPNVWRDTWLRLPVQDRDASYQCVFTGESFRPVDQEGIVALSLGELTARFPVVVIEKRAR
jgi:(1->4)-alpha-D-glucan 1-alpha-D-glucosylmutase